MPRYSATDLSVRSQPLPCPRTGAFRLSLPRYGLITHGGEPPLRRRVRLILRKLVRCVRVRPEGPVGKWAHRAEARRKETGGRPQWGRRPPEGGPRTRVPPRGDALTVLPTVVEDPPLVRAARSCAPRCALVFAFTFGAYAEVSVAPSVPPTHCAVQRRLTDYDLSPERHPACAPQATLHVRHFLPFVLSGGQNTKVPQTSRGRPSAMIARS